MGNLTQDQKTHISMVFAMAIADGDFDENEKAWLMVIGQRHGLTFEEFQEAFEQPPRAAEMATSMSNFSSDMREQIMQDCIVCAIADGKLEDNEKKLLGLTAGVLGYTMEDVVRMYKAMEEEVLNS